MARSFNGTNQYLHSTTAPIGNHPFTMACWFYPTNLTTVTFPFSMDKSGSTNGIRAFRIEGATAGDPVRFQWDSSPTTYPQTANGCNAASWNHVVATAASISNRTIILNGDIANKGTNTATASGVTDINVDVLTVAALYYTGAATDFFPGYVAEAAVWSAVLTDAEVVMLSKGYSPLMIRPASLAFYAPLIGRNSPEIDVVGGRSLTLGNTPTTVAHPRVLRPSAPWVVSGTAGGSAPNAPSSLTATAVSSSQIDLAWTDNSSDETGFELERSPNGTDSWAQVATPAANATSASDTGLSASTTYYYRIRAVNGSGNSAYSNTASDTTDAAATAVPVFIWHLRQQGIA